MEQIELNLSGCATREELAQPASATRWIFRRITA